MKRNNLTTAVVAAIAGVAGFASLANAVDLNPDGLGQVLIYPYYTVRADQASLFSVVNTTDVGKAVKVRFLEGYNSREVLDFNLYLSAHDVWVAAVTANGAGGASVSTNDKSCTSPTLPAAGQPFSTNGFAGAADDDGPQTVDRVNEGYLELITMGDIVPGSTLSGYITHVQTGTANAGTPANCTASKLDAAAAAPGNIVAPVSGGLFGSGSIVNVGQGTFYPYNADALDGFTATSLYSPPSSLSPSLQDANSVEAAAGNAARAYLFIGGQLLRADYAQGVDAVSAVFMSDTLYNEYYVDPSAASNTDWVVTFPTKRFYVDSGLYTGTPRAPFPSVFAAGAAPVVVDINLFDREEGQQAGPSPGFSPPAPGAGPSSIPTEVNIIGFETDPGATSAVFGSQLFSNITPYGTVGWLALGLTNGGTYALPGGTIPAGDPGAGSVSLNGLPATGYMGYNVINANVSGGVLANYGGLFRHRASRSCKTATPAGACS